MNPLKKKPPELPTLVCAGRKHSHPFWQEGLVTLHPELDKKYTHWVATKQEKKWNRTQLELFVFTVTGSLFSGSKEKMV